MQEVWVVTLSKIRQLQPRDGSLAPVMVSYLGTTALHLCNHHLRRRIRRTERAPAGGDDQPGSMDDFARQTRGVVTRVLHQESMDQVRRCIEGLTDDKRTVLVLRLLEGRSNQEIADALGIEPNTVAVRYRRALVDLRACLPSDDFEEIWSSRCGAGDREGDGGR